MLYILAIISNFIFALALSFYLLTCLQWFSYRVSRVAFHFTKPAWHIYFLLIPIAGQIVAMFCPHYGAALAVVVAIYTLALALWQKSLDKKLVFTQRIKRAFVLIAISALLAGIVETISGIMIPALVAVILGLAVSFYQERVIFNRFKATATRKLNVMNQLIIIQITASYGKTSIKNFLYDILSAHYKCYKTPRSVNTIAGLVWDVNDALSSDTQIYIAEAGARTSGDIAEITEFLRPHIVVVGEIGAQHIEYFKSIENVRATKLEALRSPRMKHAFVHSSTNCTEDALISVYNATTRLLGADLNGLKFAMSINGATMIFSAPILGVFNAENLSACVLVARFLGLNDVQIQNSMDDVKSVEHRLQKMENGGKIIIDDAFNGNLSGMLASYDLASTYAGRKVVITPGIVESTAQDNATLARKINEVFDLVIITGELNAKTLKAHIDSAKTVVLKNKSQMINVLAQYTQAGDLVLFSNDAPNFI